MFNALKPIANTVNQYIEKGNDVASVDTSISTGYRLNKVSLNQYRIHLEPARFVAKANPSQYYFQLFKFDNALVQLYNDNRKLAFASESLLYIYDETANVYAVAVCYIAYGSDFTLWCRVYLPFNTGFAMIEGHTYALIGDIDFCVV